MRNREYRKKRRPYEFDKITKLNALRRDGWKCVECGTAKKDTESGYLEIHHILEIWFVIKYLPQMSPTVVSSLENAACLCTDCHKKEHKKPKRYKQMISIAQGLIGMVNAGR